MLETGLMEHEFAGFFWGEGCLMIQKIKSHHKDPAKIVPYYRPVIKICLRADDWKVLKWCRDHFGGWLSRRDRRKLTYSHHHGYLVNPQVTWELVGFSKVDKVLDVLDRSIMPTKKRAELEIMRRFMKTKKGVRHTTTQEERDYQEGLKQELHACKRYTP